MHIFNLFVPETRSFWVSVGFLGVSLGFNGVPSGVSGIPMSAQGYQELSI